MSTSAKISTSAACLFGFVFLSIPAVGLADESVRFGGSTVAVQAEAANATALISAEEAEKAPADQAAKGGVIYRRLSRGNLLASHYDASGKLTRRDVYRQPNELLVIHFDNGKVTCKQTFHVWLDVYLRKGKFGYQHEWKFELRRLETFHADGKTHSRVVVFHALGGQPRVGRDINERGGTTAIRRYRLDGSLMSEERYKSGRWISTTRHSAKENIREPLDPDHLRKPQGTILVNSESDTPDDGAGKE